MQQIGLLGLTQGLESGTDGCERIGSKSSTSFACPIRLTSRVTNLANNMAGINVYVPATNKTYPCEFCKGVGQHLDDANKEIKTKASKFKSACFL